jgi:L-alanine-DL-glutamate epimerase-like enolase superfamily enzyme
VHAARGGSGRSSGLRVRRLSTYTQHRLSEQLADWVQGEIPRVKMKVGSSPRDDPARVKAVREAIGPDAQLFVDANGAYDRKQALTLAERFSADAQISWFEEPSPPTIWKT